MQAYLAPSRDDYALALEAIGRLLFAYSKDGVSFADEKQLELAVKRRGMIYYQQVQDCPGWAIKQAVDRWLRAECGEDWDYHWQPMPPEFRVVVLGRMAEAKAEADRLQRLIEAIDGVKPREARSDDSKARVAALAADAIKKMG